MAKSEDYLQSANALISVAATVGADTLTGGAASAIGGILSFNHLRQRLAGKVPDLNARIAGAIKLAIEKHPALPTDADVLIPQMIERGMLTGPEVMACHRDPVQLTNAMLAKLTDPDHLRPDVQSAFRSILTPILSDLMNDTAVSDQLRPAFETAMAETLAYIAERVDLLVQNGEKSAREFGIKEGLLIAVARNYANKDAADFDSALRGVENALQVVAAQRAIGVRSNLPEAVDEIVARVIALNSDGQLAEAGLALKSGLAEARDKVAEAQAEMLRLLESGVAQAVLERSVSDAVACLLERVRIEAIVPGMFDELRSVFREWYARGRDKGLAFDLEVAIGLATVPDS
jgi:urease gamma subunit